MTDFPLAFTTTLAPTKKFAVDDVPYEILGIDHLSDDDESETMALLSRYGVIQERLSVEDNVSKGKVLAAQMRATRISIITKLTTLPREVASQMPLSQQVRLMEAVTDSLEDDPDAPPQSEAAQADEVAPAPEG